MRAHRSIPTGSNGVWGRWVRLMAAVATGVVLATSLTGMGLLFGGQSAQAVTQGSSGANLTGFGDETARLGTNTFYAYVKAGETINANATRFSGAGLNSTFRLVDQAGTNRALNTNHTATADGVWAFTASNPAGQVGDRYYNWSVTVRASGVEKPGRVWSNEYKMNNVNSAASPLLNFWAVNNVGYVYKLDLTNYNGINSAVQASASGNPISAADCAVPSYQSRVTAGLAASCSEPYRLFFEAPAADLPQTAVSASGPLTVMPTPLTEAELTVSDLAFTATSGGSNAGTFGWTMPARFSGSYTLDIDTNGNGIYGEPVDRSILMGADGKNFAETYDFDGLDGTGDAIADCQLMNARVHFDKLGEIHIRQEDVEGRDGIRLTRLNGPNAPNSTLYWDDTALAEPRANSTPVKDGRAGTNSNVGQGVHGWAFNGNSWGNNTSIDDWSYAAVDTTGQEIAIGGRCLELSKTSSAPAQVHPGDTVTYTITVTNAGVVDYTDDAPARIEDDLSGVLDDATYNDDASNGATVDGALLQWSGALAVGETKTITYTVTVNDPATGDRIMGNTVVDPTGGGTCTTVDGCTTNNPVQTYTVNKAVDKTDVLPGDVLTYTVTVTNTGQAAYTTAAPATFTDDLAAVLDDATYNEDATNGATVTAGKLVWSGALAIGETKTITYSVTLGDPVPGDRTLTNAVLPDPTIGGSCDVTCVTTTTVSSFQVHKTASTSTTLLGGVVTYTVTVVNTGTTDYTTDRPASFSDDLGAVFDDAAYNDDATEGATVNGNTLTWAGPLAIGETKTITYSVTVNSQITGDAILTNVVVPDETSGGTCTTTAECTTTTTINAFTTAKSVSATSVVPGDVLTYTITVTNIGGGAYTDTAPASFVDDLSAVLDDAVYNDDADNGAVYDAPSLSWAGALAIGESKTITYTVTVNDPASGDGTLSNAVVPDPATGGQCATAEDCVTNTPVQSFSVFKETSATSVVAGDVVPFTITLTNTGQTAYTTAAPASFTDDLSDVLDDAVYNGDADNGALYTAPTLSWSGPLAVGETITISYSLTINDPVTGDQRLKNTVVTPDGSGGSCPADGNNLDCTAQVPGQSYTVAKSASSSSVHPGDDVTYTVTVTNSGAVDYTDAAPATFTDDLSAVFDDATYNDDASGGATITGTTLAWSGALAIGETVIITYSVQVNTPQTGDGILTNAVVPTTRGGTCDPEAECIATTTVASYTVAKSSDVASVVPGGVVTYAVTITNTGQADYTTAAPATLTDDLSGVLDDAVYNDDATNGASVTGSTLTWSGPLAIGESATVTYSVTVGTPPAGDRTLHNVVVPGDNGGSCDAEGDCETTTPVSSFTVAKTASTATVLPGATVTYTVTVTNTGQTDYTEAAPAAFADDLSAVLDDASYNDDATGGATVTGTTLVWSGTLAIGATETITYSVTVGSPATGDRTMTNVVVPDPTTGGSCTTADECTTTTLVQSYSVLKTASATTAVGGDTVVYTVTVTNTGAVAYTTAAPASITDNLAGVFDDATYNDDASNGATVDGNILTWTGPLAVGASTTITYSVTVKAPSSGDHSLVNTVTTPPGSGGECETCGTVTPIAAFTALKASDSDAVIPGAVVTYTITLTNTGAVDYTEENPASFTDDLSGILDDATYNDDATGGAAYTAPVLSWSGALPIGETVTITYSATVNAPATGDGTMANTVVTPPGIGGSCEPGSTNPECSVSLPGPRLALAKTQSTDSVLAGDTVTYTVTVTNVGDADYTTASPAAFTDDLSAVLDDATYNDDANNGATVTGAVLSWTGPLAAGATTTITYSVTVDAPLRGDRVLTNVVSTPPTIASNCVIGSTDADCTTTARVASFTTAKVADVSTAAPGDTVTYSVTVVNTGQVAYTGAAPAAFTDDLSAVLDDATYNEDASGGATISGATLTWSGPLAVGASTVITYSVTLTTPATGDRSLVNVVLPDASAGGECATEGGCTVTVPVSSYDVTKVVSVTKAKAGGVVAYTITVTNTGQVPFTDDAPATFTDDLGNVLRAADYNDDATATTNGKTTNAGTTSYSTPVLAWSGPLAVGATAEITYSVTVKNLKDGANLHNLVVVPASSGSGCVVGSGDPACAADTLVDPPVSTNPGGPLAITGAESGLLIALATMLLAAGAGILFARNRKRVSAS